MNNFLAIIPARGGSKRLPRKNMLELNGKPLIQWTIEAALDSKNIDTVCVTSDDDDILQLAKNFGVHVIKRPDELASDTATTFDAIKHAIESVSELYNYIVLLQPTSPLRTAEHIDKAIQLLNKKSADAVISVCETEHSPLWCNTIPANDSLNDFLKNELRNVRSQDLPTYYRLNGAIYICKTKKLLLNNGFFLKRNIFAFKMNAESSIDIDNQLDFYTAQNILKYFSNIR